MMANPRDIVTAQVDPPASQATFLIEFSRLIRPQRGVEGTVIAWIGLAYLKIFLADLDASFSCRFPSYSTFPTF